MIYPIRSGLTQFRSYNDYIFSYPIDGRNIVKLRYIGTSIHNSQNKLSLRHNSIHDVYGVKWYQDGEGGIIEIDGIDQPISLRDLINDWEYAD